MSQISRFLAGSAIAVTYLPENAFTHLFSLFGRELLKHLLVIRSTFSKKK
jgi:hypothetical protein